jgi:hypothetical protein
MDVCILNQAGAILLHRHMPASPAPFLQAIAPSRTAVVGGGAGLVPGAWLAALGARAGLPWGLGPALENRRGCNTAWCARRRPGAGPRPASW